MALSADHQKALDAIRAETAAYNTMIEASNNWIDRGNAEQQAAYEQARDNWHVTIQTMNDEFTAHPECFAVFKAAW